MGMALLRVHRGLGLLLTSVPHGYIINVIDTESFLFIALVSILIMQCIPCTMRKG